MHVELLQKSISSLEEKLSSIPYDSDEYRDLDARLERMVEALQVICEHPVVGTDGVGAVCEACGKTLADVPAKARTTDLTYFQLLSLRAA